LLFDVWKQRKIYIYTHAHTYTDALTIYFHGATAHSGPEVIPGLQAGTAEGSRLQKQHSTQSTAHYHSTIKCNLSAKTTKRSP
jgi:hypothetical protein